ncbi:MAG: hypothetical protein IPK00_22810 [Deltaproteobacteria bacterium]|nr:hypothetical protein [Deltaproteobacteria bacterium]
MQTAVVQTLASSVQVIAVPTQTLSTQVSLVVQTLLSLQAVPLTHWAEAGSAPSVAEEEREQQGEEGERGTKGRHRQAIRSAGGLD